MMRVRMENSKPYAVEETSSWDGTTADATFQFELADVTLR